MTTRNNNDLEEKRIHLEEITHNFFSKWHRLILRWTLRRMIEKADELRNNSDYGRSACGCYVDDVNNTLCGWHWLDAYLN